MCVSIYSENIDRDESKIKWFIETLARLVKPKKQKKNRKSLVKYDVLSFSKV